MSLDASPRAVVLAVVLSFVAVTSVAVAPVSAHTNEVSADSQVSVDGTVTAETAFVLSDAWLVVHLDDDGSIGEPVGHERVRSGGLRTDVQVSVDQSVWADWEGARRVHLVLHNDDGDGEFDPDDDPVLSTGAEPATTRTTVEKGDRRAYVSAEGFDAVPTNGSVTARRAALPADGFLVLENPDDGTAMGRAAVDGGVHENVTLRIDETTYRQQPETFDLAVALYGDDGDGEFGDGDRSVRAGDDRVATTVTLERTDGRTPTPGDGGHDHEHDGAGEHEHDEGSHDSGSEGTDGGHDHGEGESHSHGDGESQGDGESRSASTGTATVTPTVTPAATSAPTATVTDTQTPGPPGAGGPGFGATVAVAALALAGLGLGRLSDRR